MTRAAFGMDDGSFNAHGRLVIGHSLPAPDTMLSILCQQDPSAALDQLTNLGVAGFMGVMWLWERRTSRQREEQIDEAHARIMADRVQLDQLIDVVRTNAQAMTELSAVQSQLVGEIRKQRP